MAILDTRGEEEEVTLDSIHCTISHVGRCVCVLMRCTAT